MTNQPESTANYCKMNTLSNKNQLALVKADQ